MSHLKLKKISEVSLINQNEINDKNDIFIEQKHQMKSNVLDEK